MVSYDTLVFPYYFRSVVSGDVVDYFVVREQFLEFVVVDGDFELDARRVPT